MCSLPVPCQCVLEKRAKRRDDHMNRSQALEDIAYRLSEAGQITEAERDLLYEQALSTWDDAIHIASPDDPLRSLCGHYGRNLTDLPDRPDGMSGCWTCLGEADKLSPQEAREAVLA